MSVVGPHDTLHLEWIIHICLEKQAYMGDLSSMAIESNHKEGTCNLYKFDVVCFHIVRNKPENMMLLGSAMFSVATAGHGYA